MTNLDDLQKALQDFFNHFDAWFDVLNIPLTDMKDIDKGNELREEIGKLLELFSAFQKEYDKQVRRLKVAEEKNVEYAKLVAGQAEEYAEKMGKLSEKNLIIPRKQLQDLHSRLNEEIYEYIKTDFEAAKYTRIGKYLLLEELFPFLKEHHYFTVAEAREKLKEVSSKEPSLRNLYEDFPCLHHPPNYRNTRDCPAKCGSCDIGRWLIDFEKYLGEDFLNKTGEVSKETEKLKEAQK